MLLNVTSEHIERGQPGRVESCPIALAAKEAMGPDYVIAACYFGIFVSSNDNWGRARYFRGGRAMVNWMKRFDDGKPVKPHVFVVKP